ncbi:hypothetical protein LSAT2_026225 [Lamellibrachia satsuma]|nr:hypothetical protein LSAT2_026225 [Lamellibrachia satsuma]
MRRRRRHMRLYKRRREADIPTYQYLPLSDEEALTTCQQQLPKRSKNRIIKEDGHKRLPVCADPGRRERLPAISGSQERPVRRIKGLRLCEHGTVGRKTETGYRSRDQRHPKYRTTGAPQSQHGADEKEATGDQA